MKLNYKMTFIIGLGFFTVSIVWAIYNVAVPLYLDDLGLSGLLVGIVMTFDNIFAVLFLPFFGSLSDRTWNRFGRRMPFILIGIPLSALAFILIPFSIDSLIPLMGLVIALNFFMSIYRAPTVGLMPDFTPRQLRSKANGIINFMGGLGAVVAFLVGGILFSIGESLPFIVISLTMVVTVSVMKININEKRELIDDGGPEIQKSDASGKIDRGRKASLVFLLIAIFFWYAGFNAIETFVSTYGEKVLEIGKDQTSLMLTVFSAFFLLFCIPSGLIGSRIGRKRTIVLGLGLIMLIFICIIPMRSLTVMYPLLAIGGIGWALININSYPMVVEMTSNEGIGRYTGYYYLFSMLASIGSPILYGFLKDLLGEKYLFLYASMMTAIAFAAILFVRHGEAMPKRTPCFESLESMDP